MQEARTMLKNFSSKKVLIRFHNSVEIFFVGPNENMTSSERNFVKQAIKTGRSLVPYSKLPQILAEHKARERERKAREEAEAAEAKKAKQVRAEGSSTDASAERRSQGGAACCRCCRCFSDPPPRSHTCSVTNDLLLFLLASLALLRSQEEEQRQALLNKKEDDESPAAPKPAPKKKKKKSQSRVKSENELKNALLMSSVTKAQAKNAETDIMTNLLVTNKSVVQLGKMLVPISGGLAATIWYTTMLPWRVISPPALNFLSPAHFADEAAEFKRCRRALLLQHTGGGAPVDAIMRSIRTLVDSGRYRCSEAKSSVLAAFKKEVKTNIGVSMRTNSKKEAEAQHGVLLGFLIGEGGGKGREVSDVFGALDDVYERAWLKHGKDSLSYFKREGVEEHEVFKSELAKALDVSPT